MIENAEFAYIEHQVRKLFKMNLRADRKAIKMTLTNSSDDISPHMKERMNRLDKQITGMETLYHVLSENEKLVLQRHYVAGLDWDCVGEEFAQKWGEETRKSKRSLINYQNRAFRKMADYVIRNREDFDFQCLMEL